MKQQWPAIILAILCIVLALGLNRANKENVELAQQIAELMVDLERMSVTDTTTVDTTVAVVKSDSPAAAAEEVVSASDQESDAGRRMMSNMAKMMDNPTMNKVMVASQRGAIGALYTDLIDFLDLDAEETAYFMDLLMHRQMKNVDFGMKMMSGTMTDEEKKMMTEELETAGDTVKEEMEKFLNNPDDFAEWEFYEKTMGERMMLSQMDQQLSSSDAPLTDESYRELLNMMSEERENYDFSSDLNDDKNMDLSAERFSKDNIDAHANDIRTLNEQITTRAESILTPEQYTAFVKSLKSSTDMQIAQLEMVQQMFGGKDE